MPDTLELTEIFKLDPLGLTKNGPEIVARVKGFRDMRSRFNLGDVKAGKVKETAADKKAKSVLAELGDDFGDLKI